MVHRISCQLWSPEGIGVFIWVSNSTFVPIPPGWMMGTQDTWGARKDVLSCQTRKPVPLLVGTLEMKPLMFWENPRRRIVVSFQVKHVFTWDLGTWAKTSCSRFTKYVSGNKYGRQMKPAFCHSSYSGYFTFLWATGSLWNSQQGGIALWDLPMADLKS